MSTVTETISAMVIELTDAAVLIAAAMHHRRAVTSDGWMLGMDPLGHSLGEWLTRNADWETFAASGGGMWYRAPQSGALLDRLAAARVNTTITLTPEEQRERIKDLTGTMPWNDIEEAP